MNTALNIAVNLRLLTPGRMEGISRFAWETTKRMVLNNPQNTYFFIFDRAFDENLIIADNIVPLVVGPQARHPWLWYWWFEQRLPRLFKKHNIDVFYSPEFYISLKANVPTLMVSHDIVFETYRDQLPSGQQKYLEKNSPRFHKRADHIVAVSEFTKSDIVQKYNLVPSKISVAGNACPEGFEAITDSDKKEIQEKYSDSYPYILFVGAIHPRKNLIRMIQAFGQYKKKHQSGLKFLVIGRMAWNSAEIKQAIINTKDVIYYASIEEELKPMMAGAELLMFASLFEGFGIPILEGMKCEIPVLTSNVTSMKEVAGDAAILVDPESIDSIASGIEKLMGNQALAKALVEKGKKRVLDFNWDDISSVVEEQIFALSKK